MHKKPMDFQDIAVPRPPKEAVAVVVVAVLVVAVVVLVVVVVLYVFGFKHRPRFCAPVMLVAAVHCCGSVSGPEIAALYSLVL